MNRTLIALPGFLGLASDWTSITPSALVPQMPVISFWECADWLNNWALSLPAPRVLAGYSLGGRLAMHALIRHPRTWSEAVIISSHTGLDDIDLKEKRLANDRLWSIRFMQDSWESLMSDWNQNGALKSSRPMQRNERDYSREFLSKAMDTWSLGRQDNLKPLIEELETPITWLAGEKDTSFCQIAQSIKFRNPKSHAMIIPDSGHRILHDNPQTIRNAFTWKHSPQNGKR